MALFLLGIVATIGATIAAYHSRLLVLAALDARIDARIAAYVRQAKSRGVRQ